MAIKTVVGRLGNVPEVRAAAGKHVAVFSVAETKRKFNRDTQQWEDDFTLWHDCESWKNPDAIGRLEKGTWVIVEVEEKDGSYQSRETGKTVRKLKLDVRNIGVLVRDQVPQQSAGGGSWGTPQEVF